MAASSAVGKGAFILDGAATSHMVDEHVVMHDERNVESRISGIGVRWSSGCGTLLVDDIEFTDTLRVPGLGANLISESAMQRGGCEIVSKAGWRNVYRDGKLLISAVLQNGLFVWKPSGREWLKDGSWVSVREGDNNGMKKFVGSVKSNEWGTVNVNRNMAVKEGEDDKVEMRVSEEGQGGVLQLDITYGDMGDKESDRQLEQLVKSERMLTRGSRMELGQENVDMVCEEYFDGSNGVHMRVNHSIDMALLSADSKSKTLTFVNGPGRILETNVYSDIQLAKGMKRVEPKEMSTWHGDDIDDMEVFEKHGDMCKFLPTEFEGRYQDDA
jgi:hypothetical protein